MFAAILDTNVLWPSLQRNFLLSLAAEGMYRPLWSPDILEELRLCEAEKLVERGVPQIEADRRAVHLVEQMVQSFDDATVMGYEALVGSFGLPDADDEHVVAAAVRGGAGAIVTSNTRDFPQELMPIAIDVLKPTEFAVSTVEVNPAAAKVTLESMSARTGVRGPHRTARQILDDLASKHGMHEVALLLQGQPPHTGEEDV